MLQFRVHLIIYGTMTIEVYCGDPAASFNAAEQRVLAKVVGILQRRGEPAVVLTNVPCDKRECDLLVSTPVTTLVIEVKCYAHPVAGAVDDATWINPYTGTREDNPCRQVRHTMLALKDALRDFVHADPGYPRCAVVFEGGLAPGSAVQAGTDRIAIATDSDLEALLAWPLDEWNKTRRWPLELLRMWAFERGMGRIDAPVPGMPNPYARPPVTFEVRPAVQHSTAPVIVEARAARRAHRQWRFWPIIAALLAAVAMSQWWRLHQHPSDTAPIALSASKKGTGQRHHSRHSTSAAQEPVAPITSPAPVIRSVTSLEPSPANGGPLPPCPAGIDRLGCVPDSATLRQLRGE